MSAVEIICMVIAIIILPVFIVLCKRKSHGVIQPIDPLYLRVILVNWTLVPIAFSFTFFLIPYNLFANMALSFYSILPMDVFLKDWHGIIILILALILGLIGFGLCFGYIIKHYLWCYITKSGKDTPIYIKLIYWLSSRGCLISLWAIIGIDIYSAYMAYQHTYIIATVLLPITFFILVLPLYYVE